MQNVAIQCWHNGVVVVRNATTRNRGTVFQHLNVLKIIPYSVYTH